MTGQSDDLDIRLLFGTTSVAGIRAGLSENCCYVQI